MPKRPGPTDGRIKPYKGPAGGWGSLKGMTEVVAHDNPRLATATAELMRQNKADGFMCVSCAWGKPKKPHPAEFCEEGAKATLWDLTHRRCTPDVFAEHTVSELAGWSDYDLEQLGRLTDPLRYDAASDRYVACGWQEAFDGIARELKALDPKSVTFYASGRPSLEASYMYAIMARMYGSQNLPDSSNMCHESTSVGLKQSIGAPVGTVLLEDFEKTDCILFFGQNTGSNSPRMLHDLEHCSKRGVPIITFNPLKERGLERFINPQNPFEMLTGGDVRISSHYLQVRPAGDLAAMTGLCKWLIEADDEARAAGGELILDHAFIEQHTQGFPAFADFCRDANWDDIESASGLPRADLIEVAKIYSRASAVIAVYGMGLTQHRLGVQNVNMLCNLMMLRGNVGKPGSGLCPVRGHSNVQGQRSVGISEKPELAPLDTQAAQFGFEPPREKGWNTVEACEALLDGRMKGFVGLGGNLARAVPDTERIVPAWRRMRLTAHVATRLNKTHLIPGEVAYLLPTLSRIERDEQASGPQAVSMEDSNSCIHASFGKVDPVSDNLMSEPAIVAGIAKALLPPNPKLDWDEWVGDYARIRDAIAVSIPQWFKDFNQRFAQPGGFWRGNKAAKRDFTEAPGGKANFIKPDALDASGLKAEPGVMRLVTLRSNDQFNTTVYGYEDRFRGVFGTRDVLFMNEADIERLGLKDGQVVALEGAFEDGKPRRQEGLRVTRYDIPPGSVGAYYPECNVLVPLGHFADGSKTPAYKSVPVRVVA